MALHEVHWEVTNACNLQCTHCLSSSGKPRTDELTTNEAIAVLTEFCSAGVAKICFTGGEPFIRADFPILLKMAVELGMHVEVVTNAVLLDKEMTRTVGKLGVELGISLDGADALTNDSVRGKGTFEKVVENLRQCRIAGVPVRLYVTVMHCNIGQLQAFCRIAREYSCTGVHFSEIAPAGRALRFHQELNLSAEEHSELSHNAAKIVTEVFDEKLSQLNKDCWADGTTLYVTAEGDLYFCVEISQRCPDFKIGNIRSFPLKKWLKNEAMPFSVHQQSCCYGVRVSKHVSLITNVPAVCTLVPNEFSIIETLAQLYKKLDELYKDIKRDCQECQDPDCMGYIWLLKQEAEHLYERGVSLVQINDNPTFIHSFPVTSEGNLKVSERYPSCSQLCTDSRRCGIYQDRPFVCRFYPLGLETTLDGRIVWALHHDCLHIRRLEERGLLPNFEYRAREIVSNLSPQLLGEIVKTYRAVDTISLFPEGENNYSTLKEVHHVQV